MGQRIIFSIVCALVVLSTGVFATPPAGGETVASLKERMAEIQKDLDATTQRIEDLRTEEDQVRGRLLVLNHRIDEIEENNAELQDRVIRRARSLYMGGSSAMLEVLLSANDFGELAAELDYATKISNNDTLLFVRHSRIAQELRAVRSEVEERGAELASIQEELDQRTEELQERFIAARDDYEALKKKLLRRAARQAAAEAPSTAPSHGTTVQAPVVPTHGNMTCPVDGPNSFIDSWGYPRSGGRTHEGTDIMAAEGTPVVAITNGRITYAGYGPSAGNWIILSGNDGHGYWYMHNRENLVSGGSVRVGEQIATVGNTGNASGGAPHVHFEYHPGGGGPVNPYSMLRGLC